MTENQSNQGWRCERVPAGRKHLCAFNLFAPSMDHSACGKLTFCFKHCRPGPTQRHVASVALDHTPQCPIKTFLRLSMAFPTEMLFAEWKWPCPFKMKYPALQEDKQTLNRSFKVVLWDLSDESWVGQTSNKYIPVVCVLVGLESDVLWWSRYIGIFCFSKNVRGVWCLYKYQDW